MTFAVVGAGAIGAYLGAALARGGADVVVIARGPHLEAMQRQGITILSRRGDFSIDVAATDDLRAVATADVVLVTLKATSVPGVAPTIGRHLRDDAAVIAAQNGIPWWYFQSVNGPFEGLVLESVDPGGVIVGAIPRECSVGCVVYCSTEIVEPGVIRHIEGTRFALGEPNGEQSDRCVRISDAMVAGGLKAPIESDLREHVWLKLIGNAAFNPISAIGRATLGDLGGVPEIRELARGIMTECAAVASALGVELPVSIDRRLEAGFGVGNHKTSMLQDLELGRPLEYAGITGAVIELADILGVEVPQTRAVHALVSLIDPAKALTNQQRTEAVDVTS